MDGAVGNAARPVLEPVLLGAADLSTDTETWLTPKGLYAPALLQIAPSISPIRWPPQAVFSAGDIEALAGRLRQGLSLAVRTRQGQLPPACPPVVTQSPQ